MHHHVLTTAHAVAQAVHLYPQPRGAMTSKKKPMTNLNSVYFDANHPIYNASPGAFRLLHEFLRYCDHQGDVEVSERDLADRCSVGRKAIHKAIAELNQLGLIQVCSRRHARRVSRYRICHDPLYLPAAAPPPPSIPSPLGKS